MKANSIAPLADYACEGPAIGAPKARGTRWPRELAIVRTRAIERLESRARRLDGQALPCPQGTGGGTTIDQDMHDLVAQRRLELSAPAQHVRRKGVNRRQSVPPTVAADVHHSRPVARW